MKFTLREKTKAEVDAVLDERKWGAKIVKGIPDLKVCPLVVTLASGREVDVWALTENEILSLIKANMSEMTDKGFKDQQRAGWTSKILSCWREENSVSANFVKECFEMEKQFPKYVGTVKDFTTPFVHDKIDETIKGCLAMSDNEIILDLIDSYEKYKADNKGASK